MNPRRDILYYVFIAFGDRRSHENPALMSLAILFMRYHNAIARDLAAEEILDSRGQQPKSNDRDLFVKARMKTTAVLQVSETKEL